MLSKQLTLHNYYNGPTMNKCKSVNKDDEIENMPCKVRPENF